jgi:hypothetical protein
MSSLLRHTPEGFRREYLSKCSQRFEQKGGAEVDYAQISEGQGLFEKINYTAVVQKFSAGFYEAYNAHEHNPLLMKLAGEGKIEELLFEMVKKGVVYAGPYLKEHKSNPYTLLCLLWILRADSTKYASIHNVAGVTDETKFKTQIEQDLGGGMTGFITSLTDTASPRYSLNTLMKEILDGKIHKKDIPTSVLDLSSLSAIKTLIKTDLGKLLFLTYLNWPKASDDGTKFETKNTPTSINSIFNAGDSTADRGNLVTSVLPWFTGPNDLNDNQFIKPSDAPKSLGSKYVQAVMDSLPYNEFFKQGKYDPIGILLKKQLQEYMTTPSTITGMPFPVPVFVNVGHTGGGKEENPFLYFSSKATDIMKGVKLYLAGKKKQAFSPESEKQIMSAISNVGKHEKEYFAKIQEVNSQRFGSKYSMEEKQAMVDTIGKTLTLKINRLKDLINSVVTQAIA